MESQRKNSQQHEEFKASQDTIGDEIHHSFLAHNTSEDQIKEKDANLEEQIVEFKKGRDSLGGSLKSKPRPQPEQIDTISTDQKSKTLIAGEKKHLIPIKGLNTIFETQEEAKQLSSRRKDSALLLKPTSKESPKKSKPEEKFIIMLPKHAAFKANGTIYLYDRKSLNMFRGDSPCRQKLVRLIHNKVYEWFIFFMICLNSISLAFFDNNDKDSLTLRNQVVDYIDMAFTAIFAIDCMLKIIGMGLIQNKNAYLRSIFSVIDIVVVAQGIVEIAANQSTIRMLRVFRPLKSLGAIQKLRRLVLALIASFKEMANVGLFTLFAIVATGVFGVNQYQGGMLNRCGTSIPGSPYLIGDPSLQRPCSMNGLGFYVCPDGMVCGTPSDFNTAPHEVQYDNSNMFQVSSFDNEGSSLLSIFLIFSNDGWNFFMYNLMDMDVPIIGALFSIFIRVFFMFFLFNHLLAIIISAIINLHKQELHDLIHAKDVTDKNTKQYNKELKELKKQQERRQKQRKTLKIIPEKEEFINGDPLYLQKGKIAEIKKRLLDYDQAKSANQGKQLLTYIEDLDALIERVEDLKGSFDSPFEALNFLKPIIRKRMFSQALSMKGVHIIIPVSDLPASPGPGTAQKTNRTVSNRQNSQSQRSNPQITTNRNQTQRTQNDHQADDYLVIKDHLMSVREEAIEQIASSRGRGGEQPAEKSQEVSQNLQLQQRVMMSYIEQAIETHIREDQGGVATEVQKQVLEKIHSQKKHLENMNNKLRIQLEKESKARRKQKRLLGKGGDVRELAQFQQTSKIKERLGKMVDNNNFNRYLQERQKTRCFQIANAIVESRSFQVFVTLCITANVVLIALNRYPVASDQELEIREKMNYFFIVLQIVEMILKQIAYGLKYSKDPYNIFDFILVILSVVEFVLSQFDFEGVDPIIALYLRSLRIFRVIKIAKTFRQFKRLMIILVKTLKVVAIYSLLLLIFMFTLTIVGLELFFENATINLRSGLAAKGGEAFDAGFSYFLDSFKTVFVLLTNDNWAYVFRIHFQTTGAVQATLYFLCLILIGQKIILNMFLAVLLYSFDIDSLSEEIRKRILGKPHVEEVKFSMIQRIQMKMADLCYKKKKVIKVSPFTEEVQWRGLKQIDSKKKDNLAKKVAKIVLAERGLDLEGDSLFVFSFTNPLRILIWKVLNLKAFQFLFNSAIIASAVTIAIKNPLKPPPESTQNILYWIDLGITSIFGLQFLLKVISNGFLFCGKNSYLRDGWNSFDLIALVISILALVPSTMYNPFVLKAQILRPLRLIGQVNGLKSQVRYLMHSFPQVISVFLIFLFFLGIVSIFTTGIMKGKLFSCLPTNVLPEFDELIKTKWDCLNAGGEWMRKKQNFDNFGRSMMTLYQVASLQSWSEILFQTIKTVDTDMELQSHSNIYISIYFMFFIVIFTYFLLNIFSGVVISKFTRQRDHINGSYLLNDCQKEFIFNKLLVLRSRPAKYEPEPTNYIRLQAFKVAGSKKFENLITICIIANSCLQISSFLEQSELQTEISNYISHAFAGIFALEAILKIFGLGKAYFRESWNQFDLLSVVISILEIVLEHYLPFYMKEKFKILKSLRAFRMVRLIKRIKRLNLVFMAQVEAIKGMGSLAGLLLVIMYTYSIIGMWSFSGVMRSDSLTDVCNFETFIQAFLTLIALATGDSGPPLMYSVIKTYTIDFQCNENPTYDELLANNFQPIGCGSGISGVFFFYSYNLLVNMIIMNLFVAIILEGIDKSKEEQQRLFTFESRNAFIKTWSYFDREATGFINLSQLKDFLFKVGPTIGLHQRFLDNKPYQQKFIAGLELPTYDHFTKYNFSDVLQALALRMMMQEEIDRLHKHLFDTSLVLPEKEHEIKMKIEQEISKLQFSPFAIEIESYQAMIEEDKKHKLKYLAKRSDDYHLSVHHAAADVTINHFKYIVEKRRILKQAEFLKDQCKFFLMKFIEKNQDNGEVQRLTTELQSETLTVFAARHKQVQKLITMHKNQGEAAKIIQDSLPDFTEEDEKLEGPRAGERLDGRPQTISFDPQEKNLEKAMDLFQQYFSQDLIPQTSTGGS